jgi:hypothetical protein
MVGIIGIQPIVYLFLRLLENYLTFLTVAWNCSSVQHVCRRRNFNIHEFKKKLLFLLTPKYELVMKSCVIQTLQHAHIFAPYFMRMRPTPETEASNATSTVRTIAIMQEKAQFAIWLAEGKSIVWVQRSTYKRDLVG